VVANEEYWAGRPFLNSVEIEFGKTYRDQLAALQLGRAEVVEIPAEQARRIEVGGRRVSESAPIELLALVFANDSPSVKDGKLRDALALCIDRGTIKEVVLGGEGEPAGGMLPNWITGYGFLFPSGADVTKALEERGEVNQAPAWTLSYDAADPVSQVIAERIALNARDVGLRLQPGSAGNADIRLIRIRVDSENPGIALSGLAGRLGLALPKPSDYSAQALFQAENTLLQGRRVIPLFYLPANYGLSPSVKGWRDRRDGSWSLIDLWLGAEKN
jgi:ABC-type transport system substrate-binding protein